MKIGIDIGGSHIAIGLINNQGTIITKKEKDTKPSKEFEKTLINEIVNLTTKILEEQKIDITKVELIGLAIPGTVSETHIIKTGNLNIDNFNIVSEINKYFNIPIQIRNDAKCAAIAEKEYGNLRKTDDAVFLGLGTGVGGAVFLNGNLLRPKKYEGLELGHMIIQKNGIQCKCGRRGCFEQYTSMKALKKQLAKAFKNNNLTGEELKVLLEQNINREDIQKIINNYIENLCIGIENIINIFEPEKICLGGSFTYYKDILLDKLKDRLKQRNATFNKNNTTQIVTAKLKNDAGIIGAIL